MVIKPVYQNIVNDDLTRYVKNLERKDEDILRSAAKHADYKTRNSIGVKMQKALPYLAVGAMALASGAKTQGKLSDKAASASKIIGTYAVLDVICNTMSGTKKIFDKKDENKAPEKNNSIPKTLAMIGAGFAGVCLVLGGLDKAAKKVLEKKPKIVMDVIDKVKEGLQALDKTKLASKVEDFKPVYHDFASKHPQVTSKVSDGIFPIIMAAFVGSEFMLASKNIKNREKIFTQSVTSDVIEREYSRQAIRNHIKSA